MKKLIPLALSIPLTLSLVVPNHTFAEGSTEVVAESSGYTVYEPMDQNSDNNIADVSYFVNNNENVQEVLPFSKIIIPSKTAPQVQVADSTVYNWKYVDTTYDSNVLSNTASSWLVRAVAGGLSLTVVGRVPGLFFKGAAGSVAGAATIKLPSYVGKNTWWKLKKYYDYDAYNLYTKYSVSIYSNSSRTNLLTQYIEIHKGAR